MAKFVFPSCNIEIEFKQDVIEKLFEYRQRPGCNEAGGFLFTRDLNSHPIIVHDVSVPSFKDKKSRNRFIPHRPTSQQTINQMYEQGFHYIGDWHTHSEQIPHPSWTDINTIKDVYMKSTHALHFMLIFILSNGDTFEDSYLGLTNGEDIFEEND